MEKIRFAIIGAGNIARQHASAIAAIPEAELSLVCDVYEAAARKMGEAYQIDWVCDPQDAVQRKNVDVVCICTPTGLHGEIAEAAAHAKKHLVVEKPLEITLPRIDRILQAAEENGVLLTCIFPYRFMLGVQTTLEAVRAGRLGRLVMADAAVKWYRTQVYYDGSWRGTWAMDGGGALMNQSIHSIDVLQLLAGPVKRVFARTATLAHQIEAEDTAVALLEFSNGALGMIQGSTACYPGEPARVSVHGERGSIVLEEGRIVRWELADAPEGEKERMLNLETQVGSGSNNPAGLGYEMHRRQLQGVVEALLNHQPPAISGLEARKSVELIRAMYHSNRLNAPVVLPLQDQE